MKAYKQEWKVCDVDYRIVEDARTELVIADLRVPPHEECDEAARLIAAAPDMARALLEQGHATEREGWHTRECWAARRGCIVRVSGRAPCSQEGGSVVSADAEKMRKALDAFREVEWQQWDWERVCIFRRAVGCEASDGHANPVGSPRAKPHSPQCPYAKLDALEAE